MPTKRILLPVAAAGLWIVASEFVRNELLFKNIWVDHFAALGLRFETLPLNGILWTVWSFALAYLIFALLRKFSFRETVFLSWLAAFLMMWLTLHNLQVLPLRLLVAAIPLSLLEVVVGGAIIRKLTNGKSDIHPS